MPHFSFSQTFHRTPSVLQTNTSFLWNYESRTHLFYETMNDARQSHRIDSITGAFLLKPNSISGNLTTNSWEQLHCLVTGNNGNDKNNSQNRIWDQNRIITYWSSVLLFSLLFSEQNKHILKFRSLGILKLKRRRRSI